MSERSGRFHPLLSGAALGVSFGGCLVGLNPELLAPASAARALAVGGAVGALALSPLAVRRRGPFAGAGWLLLGAAFALSGLFAESQRSLYYLFVPNGARRVLVAVAVLSACAALACLAAALTLPRAAASLRILVALIVGLAAAPLFGRRAADASALTTPKSLPRTARRSLLVVGLEGLSYQKVTAWARDGTLPVFARLLANGSSGPLRTVAPYERSALWTSAATGKRPSKTGVVSSGHEVTPFGPLRLSPRLPGARPLRLGPFREEIPAGRARPFWEILATRGHEASVLNWPASYPARPGLVLWASERLFHTADVDPAAARPADAAERARLFRLGPGNLDHALVRALVPPALPETGPARAALLSGAAHDLTVVGATLGAVPTGPLNAAALVLSGLADAAAAQPATSEDALRGYYRFLDDTLGDLLHRGGSERTLCLFAPVGWGPPPPLQALMSRLGGRPAAASPDGSEDGLVILHGSGIRAGALGSAQVLDLAPTLLVLAGEPIARDMDGRVLAEAFDERFRESASIPIIDSFEPEAPAR